MVGLGEGEDDRSDSLNFQALFEETVQRQADGRYIVSLPIRENIRQLGSNEGLAMRRLKSFLAKTKRDPTLLAAVDAEIQEYLAKGYAEPARKRERDEIGHCLTLLAVAKRALQNQEGEGQTSPRSGRLELLKIVLQVLHIWLL